MEVRVVRRDRPPAPLDSTPHDVDSFVAALQPAGEADRDPPYSATDIEHVLIRAETAQIHEELPKLVSGGPEVAAPDKPQPARRRQRIPSAEDRIAGVEGRRAQEPRRTQRDECTPTRGAVSSLPTPSAPRSP